MELINRQVLDLWNRYRPTIAVDAIEYDRELKKLLSTNLASLGTDLISRRAAIDALYSVDEYNSRSVKAIKQLPPIQPKRGKWIYQNGMIKCDQCLRAIRRIDHDGLLNFCPNCGADMREVNHESN